MISIGVDTGLANAITVLDAPPGAARPRLVSTRTIAIGHKVKLAKPRRLKGAGKNGADHRLQLDETVIDDGDLREFWLECRDVFERLKERCAPLVVTVERVDKVIPRARFGGSMGTGLVRAAWIGGEIASLARAVFGPESVYTVSEEHWREALIGGTPAKGMSEDQMIARLIPMVVEGWPDTSNNHNRDSGGIAYWGINRVRMVALRDRLNEQKQIENAVSKIRFT